jgi:hypothetical protein
MRHVTGTVVDGKIVVEGWSLPEGTVVTVLTPDPADNFEIPAELEAELEIAMAEHERGESITAAELFERLRRIA